MTPASESSTRPADDDTGRAVLRSPGLAQFRKSPFRVLRLAPAATAKQAVWKSSKALARARIGQALPDPDPTPWLAPGDEIEIQEAAQTMESPLARMVEQLLWFDPSDDPSGTALGDALTASDGGSLHAYLDAAPTRVAQRLNQANLCLLLGFSQLHGVGPAAAASSAAELAALTWQDQAGLSVVTDAHRAVRTAAPGGARWADLLGKGITGWGDLLASPELADHVRTKIFALGDERVTADDLETLLSGVRTRLADLLVAETKLAISGGSLDHVSRLCAIAAGSNIDAEIWRVAFRPLRSQFILELADLAPETETGLGVVEDVSAYLDRLSSVAGRWRPIDSAQLLGLSSLIDDALQGAFGRLRTAPRATQLDDRFSEVLQRLGALAGSPSFKERLKGYRERLVDMAHSMCHFCRKRELEVAHCAAVSSRVETHREAIFNGTRIHYKVGAMPVARCEPCAVRHDFIRTIGYLAFFSLASSIVLLALVHPSTWFTSLTTGAGAVLAGITIVLAAGVAWIVRAILATRVTPRAHRKFDDYLDSHAVAQLRGDGFHSFSYDFRPNAWQLVTQQGAAHRHGGGNLGASLKVLVYVGVAILFVALRAC